MTRQGRPSARGARKRNLMGPWEILERIQATGGVPDKVIEELKQPRPPNPRVEAANEEIVAAIEGAMERLTEMGIEHESGERRDPTDPDPHTAAAREMAWIMSVTNSMKESAPRKKWCRHMRAADPSLSEIRTIAAISAGVWMCVECMRQASPAALSANPWPDECDLCGAKMEAGHFNELAFNIPGCLVNCTVCDHCAGYMPMRTKS